MPATGWTSHDAAVLVARQQHIPAAERRELLAALGLLDDTGTAIRPDPTVDQERAVDVAISLINDSAVNRARSEGREPPPPKGRYCPPGLRRIIEGGAPVPVPVKPPPPKPAPRKPKPKKPVHGGGRARVKCGTTPNGARGHRYRGEPVCQPCRDKEREHQREWKRAHYVPKPRPAPAPCGTPAGYCRHQRKKEKICDPCRLAHNATRNEQKANQRRRRAAQAA